MIIYQLKAKSQPGIKLQYSYLHSPTIDKIFQAYNSSRPWNDNKLIPLTHGYGGTFGWNWRVQKSHEVHLLPEIGYSLFSTQASNNHVLLRAGLHDFHLSASIRMHPKSIFKSVQNAGILGTRFFLSLKTSFHQFRPFVQKNNEKIYWTEGTSYKVKSNALSISMGGGFHLFSVGRFIFTPEASFDWFPSLDFPKFAEAVNGHNTIGLINHAENVFFFNAGLRITFVKSQKNWWDVPRQGDKT